ncbi:DMT family transporter [Photobacterium toruni]|uniref:EamA family transporter n=1 Tax=Photobacterium toruni TaxID=1935446 RepID=A0ABU6L5R0_9GAMM|nr:EamA family transporter [Photobacterium toruni]MEC6831543.1 EamA family transporter [Photobacterium toruni]
MNDKNRGLLLAFIGIMILSFDSLLVKLSDSTAWNVLFWRGAFQCIVLVIVQLIYNRKQFTAEISRPSLSLLGLGLIFATSTICFIESLHYTQVASTLVIINTAPFFTAILGFLILKEKLKWPTLLAIGVATSGIWIIFAFAPAGGQWIGNVLALVTALATAIYLVAMRKTKGEQAANILIIAGFMIAVFAYIKGAQPFSLSHIQMLYLLILGGIVVPGSYICISKSAAYIPAAQTSLILLMEILLGPLYVFLVIGEQPSLNDILGGAIILITLGLYTIWDIKQTA